MTSDLTLTTPDVTDRYDGLYGHLRKVALSVADSADLLAQIATNLAD